MNLRIHLAAAACVAVCVGLVAYKIGSLGYAFDPRAREERWTVEVRIDATGRGERARVHLLLPAGAALSRLVDERFTSPGMKLAIGAKSRRATFTSDAQRTQGPMVVTYRLLAQLPRDERLRRIEPPKVDAADGLASEWVPADAPEIRTKAEELNPGTPDAVTRLRNFYDFVLDELAATHEGQAGTDALAALASHRGGALARVRLFVALVRAAGMPARVVRTVGLEEGGNRPLHVRAEAFAEGRWIAIDPVRGRFGTDAEDEFALQRGDGDFVRTEGLDAVRTQVTVMRELVSGNDPAQRGSGGKSLIDLLSLASLPPRTQLVFRVILLVPLGALIVALFRNLVGVPTFGTFSPILIALALRETTPLSGLAMLGIVLAVGFAGRRVLDGLRLLLVPRLGLLLTLVIFTLSALAVVAGALGLEDGLGLALLPMVILTMTIERLSVLLEEEGPRNTLKSLAGTLLVAAAGYLAIRSDTLQRVVFTFPELNLLVVAMLLETGRYTGYRATELLRFRALATRAPSAPSPADAP